MPAPDAVLPPRIIRIELNPVFAVRGRSHWFALNPAGAVLPEQPVDDRRPALDRRPEQRRFGHPH